jgi:hypothetical protein
MRRWFRFLLAAAGVAVALPGGAIALGAWFVPAAVSDAVGTSAADLGRSLADEDWHQVQIEQHLIIRITPGNPAVMRDIPPPAPEPLPVRLRERHMAPCVPVSGIAGVRPLASNRLLLIMRDHHLVGADLSRTCAARDFYMGFYVSPTADGQLCVLRDTIHSRAGSTCTITNVHEMVPAN